MRSYRISTRNCLAIIVCRWNIVEACLTRKNSREYFNEILGQNVTARTSKLLMDLLQWYWCKICRQVSGAFLHIKSGPTGINPLPNTIKHRPYVYFPRYPVCAYLPTELKIYHSGASRWHSHHFCLITVCLSSSYINTATTYIMFDTVLLLTFTGFYKTSPQLRKTRTGHRFVQTTGPVAFMYFEITKWSGMGSFDIRYNSITRECVSYNLYHPSDHL